MRLLVGDRLCQIVTVFNNVLPEDSISIEDLEEIMDDRKHLNSSEHPQFDYAPGGHRVHLGWNASRSSFVLFLLLFFVPFLLSGIHNNKVKLTTLVTTTRSRFTDLLRPPCLPSRITRGTSRSRGHLRLSNLTVSTTTSSQGISPRRSSVEHGERNTNGASPMMCSRLCSITTEMLQLGGGGLSGTNVHSLTTRSLIGA